MSDMFICPTCKRPTHPTDNEIIEHLAKEIDRYTDVLIKRTIELDRTRKALEIAVDALKLFDSGQYTPQPDAYGLKTDASRLARKALEQITALEQKDVK